MLEILRNLSLFLRRAFFETDGFAFGASLFYAYAFAFFEHIFECHVLPPPFVRIELLHARVNHARQRGNLTLPRVIQVGVERFQLLRHLVRRACCVQDYFIRKIVQRQVFFDIPRLEKIHWCVFFEVVESTDKDHIAFLKCCVVCTFLQTVQIHVGLIVPGAFAEGEIRDCLHLHLSPYIFGLDVCVKTHAMHVLDEFQ